MVDRSTHEQIITAMTQVFDLMDGATLEVWDGLTGLQIQLLRVVATDMRVDRQSLSTWTRTSRAALVPSLGALLQRGILAEEPDDEGVRAWSSGSPVASCSSACSGLAPSGSARRARPRRPPSTTPSCSASWASCGASPTAPDDAILARATLAWWLH